VSIVIVGWVLLSADDPYRVNATFVSASQLVEGNNVTVAGEPVGTVEDIRLTDDGQARVEMAIDADGYAPLRQGTRAIIRQASLSGYANRYVELQLGGADRAEIDDGGTIDAIRTQSVVELDQLFNTFDPEARRGFRDTIAMFGEFNAGKADEAQAALTYFSPALSSSTRLFEALNRNRGDLDRFIVETSRLVTDVAARDADLSGLVRNLSTTLTALGDRRDALGDAVGVLPTFMRRANSTFVNLRTTLDAVDPLVADATPVVRDKLIPLFDQLRPFARDAAPTVRDLSRTIRRPGSDNDLVELLRLQPAVDRAANDEAQRNGARRPGAFPAIRSAAEGLTPQLAFQRPYSVDLVGWLDDFSSSGAYDALGGFSRAGLQLNAFTFSPLLGGLLPVPPELREQVFAANVVTGRNNRCPGSVERPAPDGSNPWKPSPDYNCDASQTPPGR
jgi:phospholipid/cholesterol/gamma-HCH transport system substrate-binding protein